MRKHVDANHVREAEGAGARPSDGRAGKRVDFFYGEVLLLHQANRVQHRESPDAVGDEVRSVARVDNRLAEAAVGELGYRRDGCRVALGRGDDLQQAHVARRIEEVRAEPAAAEVGRHLRGDRRNGQTAGVGSDDGVGAQMRRDFLEQRLLDGEVFGDGFDDPVAGAKQGKVVFEIARRDETRGGAFVEGRRFGFLEDLHS